MNPEIALDIDGTLLDYNYIPGAMGRVNEALVAEIAERTSRVTLVTNQGGLVWGVKGSKRADGRQYPKPADFNIRLRVLQQALRSNGVEIDAVHISVYHPKADQPTIDQVKDGLMQILPLATCPIVYTDAESRKPSPKMLLAAGATIYYGDSDEDAQAALAAGVEFVMVDRFMG